MKHLLAAVLVTISQVKGAERPPVSDPCNHKLIADHLEALYGFPTESQVIAAVIDCQNISRRANAAIASGAQESEDLDRGGPLDDGFSLPVDPIASAATPLAYHVATIMEKHASSTKSGEASDVNFEEGHFKDELAAREIKAEELLRFSVQRPLQEDRGAMIDAVHSAASTRPLQQETPQANILSPPPRMSHTPRLPLRAPPVPGSPPRHKVESNFGNSRTIHNLVGPTHVRTQVWSLDARPIPVNLRPRVA